MVGVRHPSAWRSGYAPLQRAALTGGRNQPAHADGDAARNGARWPGDAQGVSRGPAAGGVLAHVARENIAAVSARTGRLVRCAPRRGRRRARSLRRAQLSGREVDPATGGTLPCVGDAASSCRRAQSGGRKSPVVEPVRLGARRAQYALHRRACYSVARVEIENQEVLVAINTEQQTIIRQADRSDAASIASIYNHYVAETVVTFDERPISTEEMARRVEEVQAVSLPWLVAELDDRVVGYAYAAPWKRRAAYRFSVEITVYLDPNHFGRRLGTKLYSELFAILRTTQAHAVIGGIALPNDASVALHEKFGMHKVAVFEEVGFKFNRWIDVGYWQRTL